MNSTTRNNLWLSLLFLGLIGELGFLSFSRHALGDYASPVAWLAFGILTSVAAFILLTPRTTAIATNADMPQNKKNLLVVGGVFLVAALLLGFRLSYIFAEFPIGQHQSDIIPSIQMYVRRLLSGAYPYTPLHFDGWTVLPTYFPMMWLPYVFSEILEIDYRWTAYLLFVGVCLLYIYRLTKQVISQKEMIFKALLPLVLVIVLSIFEKPMFGHAVELAPISFYLLLCFALFHRNQLLFAAAILSCLLSRYAFTFWLPLTMLIYWAEFGFKNFFKVSLYVLIGVLILYVIPFLSKDWDLVTNGLKYYEETAIKQWELQKWQNIGDKPYHLFQGLSFSAWFYDWVSGSSLERMNAARFMHGIVSLIAATIIGLTYLLLKRKKSQFNVRLLLLVGLKFYLIIFYGFIYVPFSYLFMLPLFISIPLIYEIPLYKSIK